jgi:hypothetical protein
MTNVYFVEQVQHNKTTNQWTKGVVVKADPEADNEAAALQSYHAYLGAYGYGNSADIDYVYCRLYAVGNIREPLEEEWNAME